MFYHCATQPTTNETVSRRSRYRSVLVDSNAVILPAGKTPYLLRMARKTSLPSQSQSTPHPLGRCQMILSIVTEPLSGSDTTGRRTVAASGCVSNVLAITQRRKNIIATLLTVNISIQTSISSVDVNVIK